MDTKLAPRRSTNRDEPKRGGDEEDDDQHRTCDRQKQQQQHQHADPTTTAAASRLRPNNSNMEDEPPQQDKSSCQQQPQPQTWVPPFFDENDDHGDSMLVSNNNNNTNISQNNNNNNNPLTFSVPIVSRVILFAMKGGAAASSGQQCSYHRRIIDVSQVSDVWHQSSIEFGYALFDSLKAKRPAEEMRQWLLVACRRGLDELARIMIDVGIDPGPLPVASFQNMALNNACAFVAGGYALCRSPLDAAVRFGHHNIVRYLFEQAYATGLGLAFNEVSGKSRAFFLKNKKFPRDRGGDDDDDATANNNNKSDLVAAQGTVAMRQAALCGHARVVEALFRLGVGNVDTALIEGCSSGRVDVVKFCLTTIMQKKEKKCHSDDDDVVDNEDDEEEQVDSLLHIITQPKKDEPNKNLTPLQLAILSQNHKCEIVEMLLASGASPMQKEEEKGSRSSSILLERPPPLFAAARVGCLRCVRAILSSVATSRHSSNGANGAADDDDAGASTAGEKKVQQQQEDAVVVARPSSGPDMITKKMLLNQKLKPTGITAIAVAASHCNWNVVKALMEHPDIDLSDMLRPTTSWSKKKKVPSAADRRLEQEDLLMGDNMTFLFPPLQQQKAGDEDDVVKEEKCHHHFCYSERNDVMFFAVLHNHEPTVRALVERGYDVDVPRFATHFQLDEPFSMNLMEEEGGGSSGRAAAGIVSTKKLVSAIDYAKSERMFCLAHLMEKASSLKK